MPQVQEVLTGDHAGSGAAAPSAASRLFKSPGTLSWQRRDWPSPLGSFDNINFARKRTEVGHRWVTWVRVDIPELLLARGASLLLLQGQSLSQLLIPNHELVYEGGGVSHVAHLILRVDPWRLWEPVPRLTGLVLAKLGEVPKGIPPTELLAALASDSAPA